MQPFLCMGSFLRVLIGVCMRKNAVELEKAWRGATGLIRGGEQHFVTVTHLYKKRVVRKGVSTLERGKQQCHMNDVEKTRYEQLVMIFQFEN